jgi:hypothetical protein
MRWRPYPREERLSYTYWILAIGEIRNAAECVFSLRTTDQVFLLRIGKDFVNHFSPQKVRTVRASVCGSQAGLSIDMEGGFECAAARGLGEVEPVSPFLSRIRPGT